MESIVNSIKSLFENYGFRAASIVVATVIIVNFVKKPIVRRAELVADKAGVDKSVITKYITALPVAVAFIIEFFVSLVAGGFNVFTVDYATVLSRAVLYGALAVATYESVKKQMEAYAAKKNHVAAEGKETCETEKVLPGTKEKHDEEVVFSAND